MVRVRRRGGCLRGAPRQRPRLVRDAIPGLLLGGAGIAAARLARRNTAALAQVHPTGDSAVIDVVVPARDESRTIAACVAALRAQGDGVTVTVVDDGSTDGTGAHAARAGARVLRVEGPPPGWLGKSFACHTGAAGASAPWLAFIDADVTLEPGALGALVAHAQANHLDAVAPLLRQHCTGLADSLVVPFAFWQYTVGLPGAGQSGRRAVLNGQCVVVRRDVYLSSGGHGHPQVRASLIEDSALARVLAAAGARLALVRGEQLGEIRMYDSLAGLRAGFGKNVASFLAADPGRGIVVAAAGTSLSGLLPLMARSARRPSLGGAIGVIAAWTPPFLALRPCYRSARLPAAYAAAHPLAAQAMQAIAIESLVRHALHRPPRWKGRDVTAIAAQPTAARTSL